MIEASCHCGAVRLVRDVPLRSVTACNCSICRRYGALWAYGNNRNTRIDDSTGALRAYAWGDRTIDFFHCRRCGCLTHYEARDRTDPYRVALNARLLDQEELRDVPLRRFDGAVSWKYLDD